MLHDLLAAVCILMILISLSDRLWLIAVAASVAMIAVVVDLVKSSQGKHANRDTPRMVMSNVHLRGDVARP